jgi:predicted transcriptional regulator
MSMKTISVRLEEEMLEQVERLAEAMGRPRAWLMAHAIKKFVEQEEWFIREVEQGKAAADGEQLREHTDVKAQWEAGCVAAMD